MKYKLIFKKQKNGKPKLIDIQFNLWEDVAKGEIEFINMGKGDKKQ